MHGVLRWRDRDPIRLAAASLLLLTIAGVSPLTGFREPAITHASSSCQLQAPGGTIQHVIQIQFDNTHFTRDNPNVPSDLQLMPNLLNFINGNGVLLANHHTPLIAHTATDILSSLTGVYGDRHGVPVSNSFRYFNPNGTSNPGVSFAYWTDPIFDPSTISPTDTSYNMLSAAGTNAPAPWVPFTRAGCNVGSVATANTILENTSTDIPTVFGPTSAEAQEVKSNPGQAFADFVGIGIHCAAGDALCSTANSGKPDLLPSEPGGYQGYQGLFGHKYVAPQISPSGPVVDLNGNVIQDSSGHVGFPGFDGMSAAVSLSYVAAMQEHGVPVTYAYISDAHDNHAKGSAYGPGEAGYVAALKAYDDAFGKFFTRLANDGINQSNTLFMFTSDEGDHFVGGTPSPAGCDGVTVPCTYSQIGEINGNLAGLLATQQGITTPFKVHSDSAPTVHITGNPAADAPVTRAFERGVGKLTAVNPITGATDQLTRYLADPLEMQILHMVTADPNRTPTFTMFADPNYFLFAGAASCTSPCVTEQPGFAWNHGTISPDINTTWLGMVGPGVRPLGVQTGPFTSHTDIRPTMLALLGLRDDYQHQGRVISEAVTSPVLEAGSKAPRTVLNRLGQAYEQLDSPVGSFALRTLQLDTTALTSTDDATYQAIEQQLTHLLSSRNQAVSEIQPLVDWTGPAVANRDNSTDASKQYQQVVRELKVVSSAEGHADQH
ncbi:MAG: hypothetical protein JWO42_4051, partial [Chloroflexi bacterium]|nr:hypothetical protein [Chloroflexota bacterium]